MYWAYISEKVLNDQLIVTGSTQTHKIINNQIVRNNHSFELFDNTAEFTIKYRCQSAHDLSQFATVSKYQRFHGIQIEFPMIRRKRLAQIISNPNEYCQRQRTNKRATLAGTILKKYKDIRLSNVGQDRVMQYSIQVPDQMVSRRSIKANQSVHQLLEKKGSNGSCSPLMPLAKSPITPLNNQQVKKEHFIIRQQLGKSVEFGKLKHHRELQPLANMSSCSPGQDLRPPSKHQKSLSSLTQSSLHAVHKVYGGQARNLPKSIFKGK